MKGNSQKRHAAITHKTRGQTVAKRHAKTIKGLDPKDVTAMLQAAFAAGCASVADFYRKTAQESLDGTLPMGTVQQELKGIAQAATLDVREYVSQAKGLLDGITNEERKLFGDTVSVVDVQDEVDDADDFNDEDFDEKLASLLGIDSDDMSERGIDETSEDDGPSPSFPC